ncbi:MAG TPA: hypothetical protein VF042_11425 [Gemmatimonadaceae bacterium]
MNRSRLFFRFLFTIPFVSLACASAPATGTTPEGPRGPAFTDSVVLARAAAGDSSGLASILDKSCSKREEREHCLETALSLVAGKGYVKIAMGALNRLGNDPEIKRNGHVYAHAIGISAGSASRDVAESFTQCSESFQSGCYHGIVQAWFASLDSISAADANELCAPFRKTESDRWIRFQCVHGMGHGLTMLYNHDLPRGLAGCDLLTEWWDRHSCYSGAFMENIVNVTMPHHPANALAHHDGKSDEHAGMDHDMEGMHHEQSQFKPVDPDDQHYPCSVLPEKYLGACYEMQTSVMLYNNKGDIAGAAKSCESAPMNMRPICFSSLGRDVSSFSVQNHAEAVKMCSLADDRYEPWCYYGLVKNIIDLEARPDDGISMCRDVPTPEGKTLCYEAVGEQIMILRPAIADRRTACSMSESGFEAVCLYGARVGTEAPGILRRIWENARQ